MKANEIVYLRGVSDAKLIEVALMVAAQDFDTFRAMCEFDDNCAVTFIFDKKDKFTLTADEFAKVCMAGVNPNQKVTTIRLIRDRTGSSLIEAKCIVEKLSILGYVHNNFIVGGFSHGGDRVEVKTHIKPKVPSLGDLLRSQL